MAKRICSEPECDKVSNCKGLCRKHYKALRRQQGYRDPQRNKQCKRCTSSFAGRHDQVYCSSSCRVSDSNASREPRPKAPAPARPRVRLIACAECSTGFFRTGAERKIYCSDSCMDTANQRPMNCMRCQGPRGRHATYCEACAKTLKKQARARTRQSARKQRKGWASLTNNRSRAKHYGVEYQSITPRAIYERDAWTCGICDQPVDPGVRYPDPMSASIDHIIPMVKGGAHLPDNVQCAHFLCNSIKGDREGEGPPMVAGG